MHHSNLVNPLVASFSKVTATWQKALVHFHRTLVECGSPLELEHSQRLGLLFSNGGGKTNELQLWATLFKAEETPVGALFLKSLVLHQQWYTALNLLSETDSSYIGDQCENMAQFLVHKNLWRTSLQLIIDLSEHQQSNQSSGETSLSTSNPSKDLTSSSDFSNISEVPSFLPEGEELGYCGIGSTVCRAFPTKSQWRDAIRLLEKSAERVGSSTREKLTDYSTAKYVYCGENYAKYLEQNREKYASLSTFKLQVLLRSALREEDVKTTKNCLGLYVARKRTLPEWLLRDALLLLLDSPKINAESADSKMIRQLIELNKNSRTVKSLRNKLSRFFPKGDGRASSPEGVVDLPVTISSLDENIAVLLKGNQWKEALHLIQKIPRTEVRNLHENIIKQNITDCVSKNDWEGALMFFQ
ncbi:hypothetical protein AGDE_08013 [Angomonas deanei]|uniref:Uncharacterized protein n=1 Tax=Angomonas deanei TaxID=59799 RepID=A0A7G2CGI3_9TRYP|nr:hypothetical protein AGDE_08013 [Angomonas deanei]CAD2217803.1 hypothetical protein, conserved [Angomonas deanei]|eukprot:EPY34079.1 hypothetical protein AGDE_08013 [Angomonas deanei]